MPYVPHKQRDIVDQYINLLVPEIRSPAELNYIVTKLCHSILEYKYTNHDSQLSYSDINGIIGVLESIKLEFYRSVASPYEQLKKETNGKISSLD